MNNFKSKCIITAILVVMVVGCVGHPRHPVPIEMIGKATLGDIPDSVRTYWDKNKGVNTVFQQDFIQSFRDEPVDYFPHREDESEFYHGLAISGGGASGAFGAGILCGWSELGSRPRFKIVTGISTGALIAPYAFLGSSYDDKLKTMYTTMSTKDIVRIRPPIPFGIDSVVDSKPLKNLIDKEVDGKMLADIASAHLNGQRLYIGTTDLDAQRFVVWNMGAIATSNSPNALKLFKSILLASASIPGLFPPVYIEVEVDGQIYDEMHVDGAVFNQLFFTELLLDFQTAVDLFYSGPDSYSFGHVYVIRNGKVAPEPQSIKPKALAVVKRSLNTMLKVAAVKDIHRVYITAKKNHIDFSYIDIPVTYLSENKQAFDPVEMNALFNLGFLKASKDGFWIIEPFYEE